ncbi:hypothetical protein AX774_g133 [Zancudomyces culisetae]|uniref:Autophagy-related protein 4 n=1 Tax=Zancudomyces culisetae TaxID=1213189 RepID=A0A1R1PZ51_ZANCU|nr:hypothetical protein AX774_g133 [Zancudomyces culisetae]|eukprot:OMH86242.1 hypothetical protein AX774_g133 [Zancudomyces culisetae]
MSVVMMNKSAEHLHTSGVAVVGNKLNVKDDKHTKLKRKQSIKERGTDEFEVISNNEGDYLEMNWKGQVNSDSTTGAKSGHYNNNNDNGGLVVSNGGVSGTRQFIEDIKNDGLVALNNKVGRSTQLLKQVGNWISKSQAVQYLRIQGLLKLEQEIPVTYSAKSVWVLGICYIFRGETRSEIQAAMRMNMGVQAEADINIEAESESDLELGSDGENVDENSSWENITGRPSGSVGRLDNKARVFKGRRGIKWNGNVFKKEREQNKGIYQGDDVVLVDLEETTRDKNKQMETMKMQGKVMNIQGKGFGNTRETRGGREGVARITTKTLPGNEGEFVLLEKSYRQIGGERALEEEEEELMGVNLVREGNVEQKEEQGMVRKAKMLRADEMRAEKSAENHSSSEWSHVVKSRNDDENTDKIKYGYQEGRKPTKDNEGRNLPNPSQVHNSTSGSGVTDNGDNNYPEKIPEYLGIKLVNKYEQKVKTEMPMFYGRLSDGWEIPSFQQTVTLSKIVEWAKKSECKIKQISNYGWVVCYKEPQCKCSNQSTGRTQSMKRADRDGESVTSNSVERKGSRVGRIQKSGTILCKQEWECRVKKLIQISIIQKQEKVGVHEMTKLLDNGKDAGGYYMEDKGGMWGRGERSIEKDQNSAKMKGYSDGITQIRQVVIGYSDVRNWDKKTRKKFQQDENVREKMVVMLEEERRSLQEYLWPESYMEEQAHNYEKQQQQQQSENDEKRGGKGGANMMERMNTIVSFIGHSNSIGRRIDTSIRNKSKSRDKFIHPIASIDEGGGEEENAKVKKPLEFKRVNKLSAESTRGNIDTYRIANADENINRVEVYIGKDCFDEEVENEDDKNNGESTTTTTATTRDLWWSEMSENQHTLMQLLYAVSQRMYFQYGKGFKPVEPSSYTSDVGWGCMHRSAQMMLAEVFKRVVPISHPTYEDGYVTAVWPRVHVGTVRPPEQLSGMWYQQIEEWFADDQAQPQPHSKLRSQSQPKLKHCETVNGNKSLVNKGSMWGLQRNASTKSNLRGGEHDEYNSRFAEYKDMYYYYGQIRNQEQQVQKSGMETEMELDNRSGSIESSESSESGTNNKGLVVVLG